MLKLQKSGPAIFMYLVIALTIIIWVACFSLYYSGITTSTVVLWCGIASFMIMYHFCLIWGEFWIFLITSIAAMVFDAQFIIIQRFNRPRILKLAKRVNK